MNLRSQMMSMPWILWIHVQWLWWRSLMMLSSLMGWVMSTGTNLLLAVLFADLDFAIFWYFKLWLCDSFVLKKNSCFYERHARYLSHTQLINFSCQFYGLYMQWSQFMQILPAFPQIGGWGKLIWCDDPWWVITWNAIFEVDLCWSSESYSFLCLNIFDFLLLVKLVSNPLWLSELGPEGTWHG